MPVFKNVDGVLSKLPAIALDLERTLQRLIESNLEQVFGAKLLASEFPTTFGGRIDTLAVDSSGAPVIIEYKRSRNDNVINQALSYLRWLKSQQPGFFQHLILQKLGAEAAGQIALDWRNPRVICVAENYSKFDIDTVEVVPLRVELYKFRFHAENIFTIDGVNVGESEKPLQPAASQVPADPADDAGAETPADTDGPAAAATPQARALFAAFRERVMSFDSAVQERPTTFYVAYRVARNFAEVHIQAAALKIHLRPVQYVDPRGLVDQIPAGYNWTLDRRIYLRSLEDLDYVVAIVERSYQDVL